jgi:heme/copper-type cytochrome/quinol oxidase subunit 3
VLDSFAKLWQINSQSQAGRVGMTGFLIRWVLAFALLTATFNPTSYSYLSWALENYRLEPAISLLIGLLLVAGYIIYLRATLRSIGLIGMGLVSAIVAAGVWVLIDLGLLTDASQDLKIWIALIGLSFVLGIGLSWSHVRRAISGQSDMDDIGD